MKPHKRDGTIEPTYNYVFFQFRQMEKFLVETSEGIKLRKGTHENYIEDQVRKYPQDEHEIRYYEKFNLDRFDNDYVSILNNSALISCFALFEVCFRKVALLAMERVKAKYTVADLGSKPDVYKYKLYLEKIVGLNLEHLKSEWKKLDDFREIRNLIVHHQSNIKTNLQNKDIEKQEHFALIHKYKSKIRLNRRSGYFTLNDQEFVKEFSRLAFSYLSQALKELAKLKKRRKAPEPPKRKSKTILYQKIFPPTL